MAVSITEVDTVVDTTDHTENPPEYTFSGRSIGTAASDRVIIVGAYILGNTTAFTGVTIAGVSATLILDVTAGGRAGLWKAAVPTGTTGDIVVTGGGTGTGSACVVNIWRMVGGSSAETGTGTATAVSGTTVSDTLVIPTNGGGIGFVVGRATTAQTWAWTNLTEGTDAAVDASFNAMQYSSALSLTAGSATRTATLSSTIVTAGLIMAAFGPPTSGVFPPSKLQAIETGVFRGLHKIEYGV